MSAPGDLIPYDLEADAHLIWPRFEHEHLAVGDVFSVKCEGRPDRVLRVTRVVPGPGGQVMYDTEPAEIDRPAPGPIAQAGGSP